MMEEKIRIEVENLEKNERIDKYLSSKLDDSFSRAKIQKLIDEELILVNDKVIKSSYKVSNGDVILITDKEEDMSVKPEKMDIDIVYEDDDVMVINKKSGVVVHPAPGNYSGTLVNGLMYLSKDLSHVNGEFRPGIVHRIDKDTSGLLIVAKNDKAHRILAEELKEKKKKSAVMLFLEQFIDVLIALLIVAAIAAYFVGDVIDSCVILIAVLLNTVIGFIQEYRSEKAIEMLKSVTTSYAVVRRDGQVQKIDAKELTIGDIVILEEGDKIPADLVLIETNRLKVDESNLTGESVPVEKSPK